MAESVRRCRVETEQAAPTRVTVACCACPVAGKWARRRLWTPCVPGHTLGGGEPSRFVVIHGKPSKPWGLSE